jgi:hypothetical protein
MNILTSCFDCFDCHFGGSYLHAAWIVVQCIHHDVIFFGFGFASWDDDSGLLLFMRKVRCGSRSSKWDVLSLKPPIDPQLPDFTCDFPNVKDEDDALCTSL